MKKIVALLLVALMALTAFGCAATPAQTEAPAQEAPAAEAPAEETAAPEEAAGEKKNIKVAYSCEQLTEGISLGVKFCEEWVDAYNAGDNDYYIEAYDVYSADYEIANQIAQIEDIITKGYDAIIISSLDRTAVLEPLKAAHDAGIKVIDIRNELEGDFIDVWADGLDNVALGQKIKEMVKTYLEENPDVVLNTGIIWHEQTVPSCFPRTQGIVELSEEMPDRVKILAEVYTNSTEVGQTTMEDWLQAYPEMNFVACSMDESALGAANAMKSSGIQPGEILMSSVDGSEVGCNLLKEGYLTWLTGFSLRNLYSSNMECAVKSITGEFPAGYTFKMSDVIVLTPDMDLDAYLVEAGWK